MHWWGVDMRPVYVIDRTETMKRERGLRERERKGRMSVMNDRGGADEGKAG